MGKHSDGKKPSSKPVEKPKPSQDGLRPDNPGKREKPDEK